jgi:hypothetical protein
MLNFARVSAFRLMQAEWAAERIGIPDPHGSDPDEKA